MGEALNKSGSYTFMDTFREKRKKFLRKIRFEKWKGWIYLAPCLVLLEAQKNGAPGIFVTKPLMIYQNGKPQTNANYTDDMKYIYENLITWYYDDLYSKE